VVKKTKIKKQISNILFFYYQKNKMFTLLTAVVRKNGERPLSDFDNLSN